MGLPRKQYIDFFLVASVEHYRERITVDKVLWESCLQTLRVFFTKCVLPRTFYLYSQLRLTIYLYE